nr:MAG TPA: hypothetical protein [Caudoviricetes sp.]
MGLFYIIPMILFYHFNSAIGVQSSTFLLPV